MKRLNVIRFLIFCATTVGAWGLLSLGAPEISGLAVGQIATRDYEARYASTVIDRVDTDRLQDEAAAAVGDELRQDANAENASFEQLNQLLTAVTASAIDATAPIPELDEPEPLEATPVTTAAGEDVSTTSPPVLVTATGRVYLDVDSDGVFSATAEGRRPDQGLK